MLKRHEDALMQRFDAVANVGFTHIEWWELYLWYGQKRIGKAVWRDLKARFSETVEDEDIDLWVYSADKGLLLVHSDNLVNIADKVGGGE